MNQETFQIFLWVMSAVALVVFIALYFVKAGYGMFRTASWGISINNKLAWVLMEAPVFIVMFGLWGKSGAGFAVPVYFFFLLFQLHSLQRAFIFPLDAGRFVATVAASDAAAGALAAASYEWLRRELPIVTALPDPVLGLRLLGGTAGMIAASVEDGRCERADDVDDTGENVATALGPLGIVVSSFAASPWGSIATSVRFVLVGRLLDPGVDHSSRCWADRQQAERQDATAWDDDPHAHPDTDPHEDMLDAADHDRQVP